MNENTEEVDVVIPDINPFLAMYRVASRIWITLFISWFAVTLSILFSWEVPASGSILVCSALISEMLFERMFWRKINADDAGMIKLLPDSRTGAPIIWGASTFSASDGIIGALLSFAKENEILNVAGEQGKRWVYKATVARAEFIILVATIFTAVAGTALWGYGHLVFN